jgi:hypothetical protein
LKHCCEQKYAGDRPSLLQLGHAMLEAGLSHPAEEQTTFGVVADVVLMVLVVDVDSYVETLEMGC